MKILKLILITYVLVLSTNTNAIPIALNDWWLQTDNFGGLRQSVWNEDAYFAVSQSATWDSGAVYETPDGFHWASTAEGTAIFNSPNVSGIHTYYNLGGWSGYTWEGVERHSFRFSDSDVTGAYKHAGNYDEYYLNYGSETNFFAGLVLIKDMVAVPAPAAVWLIVLGLIGIVGSARLKKI